MTGHIAFIEMHADVDQLVDRFRPFRHDRTDDFFVAQSGTGFERVAYMQFK